MTATSELGHVAWAACCQLFYDTDVNALFLGAGAGDVEGQPPRGSTGSSSPPLAPPQWTKLLAGVEELRVSAQRLSSTVKMPLEWGELIRPAGRLVVRRARSRRWSVPPKVPAAARPERRLGSTATLGGST